MGKVYFILAHHMALGVHCVGTERRGNPPPPNTCFRPAYKIMQKDKGKSKIQARLYRQ